MFSDAKALSVSSQTFHASLKIIICDKNKKTYVNVIKKRYLFLLYFYVFTNKKRLENKKKR